MKILTSFTLFASAIAGFAAPAVKDHVVRVNSTLQSWSTTQPWDKTSSRNRRALGVVLGGNQVLTVAEMAADATYIELENAEGTKKIPAQVTAIDYESNLALLAVANSSDNSFFADYKPIELGPPANIGDTTQVWQLENNGVPLVTEASIQSADIVSSFAQGHFFLHYEAKGSLQSASSSFSVPAVKDGKLLGFLTSYNSKDQIIDILASEIIQSFLDDAKDGKYEGFPSLGIATDTTIDPNFRAWLKLPEEAGGLYLTRVQKDSAAEKAGLKKGDVILKINGNKINNKGFYTDSRYGELFWSHLVRGSHKVGDEIKLNILREGKEQQVTAKLTRPKELLVPSYMYDKKPRFLIKGGFLFQELSNTYLTTFGKDWQTKAPLDFLKIIASPHKYADGKNRIVFLSATIPTPATVGYTSLRNQIIKRVNGNEIADIPSLIKAFSNPDKDGIHTIEFTNGTPKTIYLDAKLSDIADNSLLRRGLPALSRK